MDLQELESLTWGQLREVARIAVPAFERCLEFALSGVVVDEIETALERIKAVRTGPEGP